MTLDRLYDGLTSGRWVIFRRARGHPRRHRRDGERAADDLRPADRTSTPRLPGDTTHTTLLLATPIAYSYKRDTVTIYGNVVKATHGETRNETLGSGDGSQSLQSFTLKQPPLTFVSAPNPTGVESTLEVYVNNVQWHEADTLAGLGPKDRKFITQTDDNAVTTVIFGNGEEGSRLPTGTGERHVGLSQRNWPAGQRAGRADQPAADPAARRQERDQSARRLGRRGQGERRSGAGECARSR